MGVRHSLSPCAISLFLSLSLSLSLSLWPPVAVEKANERLVGVAAPRPGEKLPSAQEVQTALAAELPAAYVPSEWHFRDALPLGSAGKVDHNLVLAWVRDQSTNPDPNPNPDPSPKPDPNPTPNPDPKPNPNPNPNPNPSPNPNPKARRATRTTAYSPSTRSSGRYSPSSRLGVGLGLGVDTRHLPG